jgi:hypothetical protein
MSTEPVWNFAAWCCVTLLYAGASRYQRPSIAEVQARESFSKPFIIWLGPVQILMVFGQLMLAIGLYIIWTRGGWTTHYSIFALVLTSLFLSIIAQHVFWIRGVCGIPALLIYVSLILACIAAAKASSVLSSAGILLFVFTITNFIPLAGYFTIMWHKKPNFDTEHPSSVNMTNNANAFVFAQDPEEHIILGPPTVEH